MNAEKVAVSGKKRTQKLYRRHSGRPGGMKVETFDQLQQRIPERIIEHAVRGMLPKGRVSSLVLTQIFFLCVCACVCAWAWLLCLPLSLSHSCQPIELVNQKLYLYKFLPLFLLSWMTFISVWLIGRCEEDENGSPIHLALPYSWNFLLWFLDLHSPTN